MSLPEEEALAIQAAHMEVKYGKLDPLGSAIYGFEKQQGSGWEGFFKQMPPDRNANVSLGAKMVSHETK